MLSIKKCECGGTHRLWEIRDFIILKKKVYVYECKECRRTTDRVVYKKI